MLLSQIMLIFKGEGNLPSQKTTATISYPPPTKEKKEKNQHKQHAKQTSQQCKN